MDIDRVNGILAKAIGKFHEEEVDGLVSISEATGKREVDWESVEHYYAGLGNYIKRRNLKEANKWAQLLTRYLDKGFIIIGPGTMKAKAKRS